MTDTAKSGRIRKEVILTATFGFYFGRPNWFLMRWKKICSKSLPCLVGENNSTRYGKLSDVAHRFLRGRGCVFGTRGWNDDIIAALYQLRKPIPILSSDIHT